MCAIVDANVASEVFGPRPSPAGDGFLGWVVKGGRLVAGGKNLRELERSTPRFSEWAGQAVSSGRLRLVDKKPVEHESERLRVNGMCQSNDEHIIALARVSGARLLYSNDVDLQQDFKSKTLIDNPRGSVYSTLKDKTFSPSRKALLRRKGLCRFER